MGSAYKSFAVLENKICWGYRVVNIFRMDPTFDRITCSRIYRALNFQKCPLGRSRSSGAPTPNCTVTMTDARSFYLSTFGSRRHMVKMLTGVRGLLKGTLRSHGIRYTYGPCTFKVCEHSSQ